MRDAHADADDVGRDRRAPDRDRGRLIEWGDLLATCVASALATLLLSRLGVGGTIVGAAVTPVIITLTTTALSNEAGRARKVADQVARKDGGPLSLDPQRRRRLTGALATAAAATGILLAGIMLAEAATDEPIREWGRGGGSSERPGGHAPAGETPTPTDTPSAGHGRAAQSSPSPTASAPTATPTATEPAAPTPTASSASPAPSPAASP